MTLYPLRSCKISIHTPAKGVTYKCWFSDSTIEISIHTPAKGVTAEKAEYAGLSVISIHTPAKGVTFIFFAIFLPLHISIHTPAKGVTGHTAVVNRSVCNFNPHSREGSDNASICSDVGSSLFQSTLPRRE
mgnify:CR=1 FL=1